MNTVIANCQTGEIIERPATPEEIALLNAQREESDAQLAENAARDASVAAARESARAKLAALGLTESEINALVGAQ
jgi:hypothetical protein